MDFMVYNAIRERLSRAFSHCLLCQTPGHELCPACSADLPWNTQACRCCALPLEAGPALCASCQQEPPPFQAFSLFRYEFPVDRLLARLKYHGRLSPARVLGGYLAETLVGRQAATPDLILPIPLHPARLGERGYNQATELARPLAKTLGLPLEHRLVRRVKLTAMQKGLDAQARAQNLRGAFRLDRARYEALGRPARVALLDDVLTTGATATEISQLLRQAGVQEVQLWSLARTP